MPRRATMMRNAHSRTALTGHRPIAPRHEHLPLGEPATPADRGGDDTAMAEHRLHAREGVVHALFGARAEQPRIAQPEISISRWAESIS